MAGAGGLTSDHVAAWRALLTVHAGLTDGIDGALREAGVIPLRWYDALLCLYEARGRRLRLADLAEAALLSRSTRAAPTRYSPRKGFRRSGDAGESMVSRSTA